MPDLRIPDSEGPAKSGNPLSLFGFTGLEHHLATAWEFLGG
jgi:hypothetical protein